MTPLLDRRRSAASPVAASWPDRAEPVSLPPRGRDASCLVTLRRSRATMETSLWRAITETFGSSECLSVLRAEGGELRNATFCTAVSYKMHDLRGGLEVRRGCITAALCATAIGALGPSAAAGRARPATVRVTARVAVGPASAVLQAAGTVTVPGATGPLALTRVAAANGTLAVTGTDTPAGQLPASSLYVYGRPAAGWAAIANPGVYTPPPDTSLDGYGIGSGFVAVTALGGGPSAVTAVLVPGAAGWDATLTPVAYLASASTTGVLAVGGATVVTGGWFRGPAAPNSKMQVFTEPTGGWRGPVAPSATLEASDQAELDAASISGKTIAVASTDAVYLFVEPPGGWSGVVHQSARIALRSPSIAQYPSVSLTGNVLTVVGPAAQAQPASPRATVPVYVVRRPASGWHAIRGLAPRGFIVEPQPQSGYSPIGGTATTDGTVVTGGVGIGASDTCPPCDTTVWAIDGLTAGPPAPLQLPIGPSTQLDGTVDASPAVDGTTLALGAQDGIHLFTVAPPQTARVQQAMLTVGTDRQPRLTLMLASDPPATPTAAVNLVLPAGLRITGSARTRQRGVTATGVVQTELAQRSRLITITFAKPQASTTLSISSGALIESRALRAKLRQIAARGGQTMLTLPTRVIDTSGRTSQSQVTFIARR
jgi:hypothetical protein